MLRPGDTSGTVITTQISPSIVKRSNPTVIADTERGTRNLKEPTEHIPTSKDEAVRAGVEGLDQHGIDRGGTGIGTGVEVQSVPDLRVDTVGEVLKIHTGKSMNSGGCIGSF